MNADRNLKSLATNKNASGNITQYVEYKNKYKFKNVLIINFKT